MHHRSHNSSIFHSRKRQREKISESGKCHRRQGYVGLEGSEAKCKVISEFIVLLNRISEFRKLTEFVRKVCRSEIIA
jgi:hypothetical protein